MRINLSEYPHDERVPIPEVKAALDYCDNRKSIRIDFFGDCFPGRCRGMFQNGFLLDASMKIWDASRGPLRAIQMLFCVQNETEANPFSIVMDACYLEFAIEVLGSDTGIYVLCSDEVSETLDAIHREEAGALDANLISGAELLPYQKDALAWMCGRTAFGHGFGLLSMEPGLGKTVVSLAYVAQLQRKIPHAQTVVTCPASVIGHWLNHANRLVPTLNVEVIAGQQPHRVERITSGTWDLAITSIKCAQRDAAAWANWHVDLLIFDEITAAKSRDSKIRTSVRRFHADRKFGLSGTPILNSLNDLHS